MTISRHAGEDVVGGFRPHEGRGSVVGDDEIGLSGPCAARTEARLHRIVCAADGLAARAAYDACVKKWTTLWAPVARSLEEAGSDLLTFYSFPKAMWKSLRTTNPLENLNREFRRRTKTQASFTTEAAAVTVLFGLVALGHVALRKIDGHDHLAAFLAKEWAQAA